MIGKIKTSVLLFLSLICADVVAQNRPLAFKHLSLKEGLSQSPIFSIMQDQQGFIWIGSRNGLTRYDGYEFKIYNNFEYDKPTGQRDINSIYEDSSHQLWLATSGGIYRFVKHTESFQKVQISDVKFTSAFYPAGHNKLWVATDRGIKLLDCKTGVVKNFISHQLSGLFVHALCKDSNGLLWSGSASGVRCFNVKTQQPVPVPASLNAQLNSPVKRIVAIKEDLDGDLWFGTEDSGLFWYQKSTGQCFNFSHSYGNSNTLLSDFVRDVFVNQPNELWVGTRNGLSVFNKTTRRFANYEHRSDDKHSLSYNTIWKIMKDKTGSIWLTTYAGGLNVYNPMNSNFSSIGERIGNGIGLNKPVVNAILGDKDGGIWAGTDGGGLNYIDQKRGIVRYYSVQELDKNKTSNIVKGLARDNEGNLWVATLDGVAKFDQQQGKVHYVPIKTNNKFHIVRTNGLLATKNGIWIAGDVDGLKYWGFDGTIKEYRNRSGQLSSNHINSIIEDPNKNGIWIGTNEGLCYLDSYSEKFTIYRNQKASNNYKSDIVISLFRDAQQRLWLGTQLGLRLFSKDDRNSFTITQADGLADNIVQAITQDQQGNLWVSTNNGISKISFKNENLKPGAKAYQVTSYSALNGLSSNLWMPNAVYNSPSGEIYFGGVNGINSFDPNKLIKNKHVPPVVVTDFLIRNNPVHIHSENSPLTQPIESTDRLTLQYDQNSIAFKFSALNFINTQRNSYAYKMEGLSYNQDWIYSGNQRTAVYTGLEPGTYTFKVKAANNDGIWNNRPKTIKVVIMPPFWLTWWAYCIYLLVGLVVFYFIVRFFRRQAKLERDLYYEHLQFERQQELHQMKLNFFTNISHELRTPLTLIVSPIEKLAKETAHNHYLHRQITMIQGNTNRLLKLVNELMDFRKTETGKMALHVQENEINAFVEEAVSFFNDVAQAKQIEYSLTPLNYPVQLYFDRDQLEKVIFNLLSNAFKFTPFGGKISVNLIDDKDKIHLSFVDNGVGIPFEEQKGIFTDFYQGKKHNPRHIGTGIGLAFSKSIIDLHHGELQFKSNPAGAAGKQETEFTITLLKGVGHFDVNELCTVIKNEEMLEEQVVNALSPIEAFDFSEPAENLSGQSVLVIEDNEEVRAFIIESLKSRYAVTGCKNGREGYEVAIATIPDLIITDVMMPEMDGMELCEKIKTDQRTNHIPVIMLTARATPVHQLDGLEKGADVYIAKPFSLQALQLNIRNLLHLRRTMQQKFSEQVMLQPKDVVIPSTDGKYLNKLMDIIELHIEDSAFGVAELAVEIGMSQPVLYRKVKALTDLSVADFIKSIRLKKAAMLLAQNKMSISDVAFAVGFNNRKHFSKEFRKQFDENPTTYMARFVEEKVLG